MRPWFDGVAAAKPRCRVRRVGIWCRGTDRAGRGRAGPWHADMRRWFDGGAAAKPRCRVRRVGIWCRGTDRETGGRAMGKEARTGRRLWGLVGAVGVVAAVEAGVARRGAEIGS